MKKFKVLLSVLAMNLLVGCGGGSDSLVSSIEPDDVVIDTVVIDTTPTDAELGIDPSGVINADDFLDKYYYTSTISKDTYETTEEYEQRVEEILEEKFFPIRDEIVTFVNVPYSNTYDADTATGTVKFTMSSFIDFNSTLLGNLNYEGVNCTIFFESETSSSDIVDTTTRRTRTDRYVFDNVVSTDDLIYIGNGNLECDEYFTCSLFYNASPTEAQEYALGVKLSVLTNSPEVDFFYDSSFTSSTSISTSSTIISVTERNNYPGSLVSIILFDRDSGKELGKIIAP